MIGLISRPHSIKGEVCVQYYADSPLLLKAPVFFVSPEEEILDAKITGYRKAKDHYIVSLDISKDRNKAETLKNYEICIDPMVMRNFLKKHTPSNHSNVDDEEVYIFQLTNCSVYFLEQENEVYLGKLEHVDFMAGQEIWRIITDDKKEVLFPAVPEFVKKIDTKTSTILLTPPEGLLDIYLNNE